MAKIVNLGGFGQPRKSALAGLPEAIAAGKERKLEREKLSGLNEYRESLAKGQEEDRKLREEKIKMEYTKLQNDQEDQGREITDKALQQLSLFHASKSPTEMEQFKQTDSYKQLVDKVSVYFPLNYDKEKKEIIPRPMEGLITDPKEAKKVMNDAKMALERRKRGLPPTVDQSISAMRLIDNLAYTMVISEEEKKERLGYWQKALSDARKRAGVGVEEPGVKEPGAGTGLSRELSNGQNIDQNDPLGIR